MYSMLKIVLPSVPIHSGPLPGKTDKSSIYPSVAMGFKHEEMHCMCRIEWKGSVRHFICKLTVVCKTSPLKFSTPKKIYKKF